MKAYSQFILCCLALLSIESGVSSDLNATKLSEEEHQTLFARTAVLQSEIDFLNNIDLSKLENEEEKQVKKARLLTLMSFMMTSLVPSHFENDPIGYINSQIDTFATCLGYENTESNLQNYDQILNWIHEKLRSFQKDGS